MVLKITGNKSVSIFNPGRIYTIKKIIRMFKIKTFLCDFKYQTGLT